MLSIRRIVLPTDFSPASRSALILALKLAKQSRAELMVIHVLPPPTPIYEAESAERLLAEAKLEVLFRKIRCARIKTRRLLIKGNTGIAKHIIESAKILKADLIVMGTHGRTGIARFLVGSAASGVIARAHCPVLVVRGRPQKQAILASRPCL